VTPVRTQKPFKQHTCSPACWGGDDVAHIANLKQVQALEKPAPFVLPLKLGFTRQLYFEAPFYLDPPKKAKWAQENKPNTIAVSGSSSCNN
jgi:hypothetical protein